MADVQNDYNQVSPEVHSSPCSCLCTSLMPLPLLSCAAGVQREGEPKVRIGNWVEQRALLATTGHTRGALVHSAEGKLIPPTTLLRTVQHLPEHKPDWLSSTQADWTEGLKGRSRSAVALPSRAGLRMAEVHRRAQAEVEEEERLKRSEEEKAQLDSRYAHRPPINRRRALGDGEGGGLDEPPITLHHSTQLMGAIRTDLAQHRAARASGLHGKNVDFSTPIAHSKGGPHHQHRI